MGVKLPGGSLKIKFAFWAAIVIVVVQIANGVILYSTKKNEVSAVIEKNAANYARLTTAKIVEYYEQYKDSGSFKFYALVDELLKQNEEITAIYLIRTDGSIVFGPENMARRSLLGDGLRVDNADLLHRLHLLNLSIAPLEIDNKPLIDIINPYLEEWGQHSYSVRYIFNFNTLDKQLAKMLRQIALISGICICLGIIMVIVLGAQVTRSLKKLVRGVRELSTGDWVSPIRVETSDEVGELSSAFNAMRVNLKELFDKLTATQNDLKALNRSLEQKVAERTLELQGKNAELERLSATDQLTGLHNRRSLDEKLNAEINRFNRYADPFGVILLDIDHFKSINDTYGHQTGDLVLQQVAELLASNTRKTDIVGRWGGEEFLIVCPKINEFGLAKLAEHLRATIETHGFPRVGTKTASFGLAITIAGETLESLVARADSALYVAKDTGRNRIEISRPDPVEAPVFRHVRV